MKTSSKNVVPTLPKGILKSDLKWPSYRSKDRIEYDLGSSGQLQFYYVKDWGWCIATLHIRNASRRASQAAVDGGPRTYAVRVDTGETVRIGLGPHVSQRLTVYIRKSRVKALEKFLALLTSGAERANQIRDRISTRRAQSAMRRSYYW